MNKELITKCPECNGKLEQIKYKGGECLKCKDCKMFIDFEITDKEISYKYDWKFLTIKRKTNE